MDLLPKKDLYRLVEHVFETPYDCVYDTFLAEETDLYKEHFLKINGHLGYAWTQRLPKLSSPAATLEKIMAFRVPTTEEFRSIRRGIKRGLYRVGGGVYPTYNFFISLDSYPVFYSQTKLFVAFPLHLKVSFLL